jgi:hypothetical protein
MTKEGEDKLKEAVDKEIRKWQKELVDEYFKLFGGLLLITIVFTILGHIIVYIF